MRRVTWIVAGLTLALGLAKVSFADVTRLLVVRAPEEFTLGKVTMPAGEYAIEETDLRASTLIFRNTATGKAEMVPIISRLSARSGDPNEASLVFDQVGKALTVSEVYIGGEEDGYLVAATPGPHKHVILKGKRG